MKNHIFSDKHIVLVIHNVRSAHNVGSLLRTADGAGVSHVFLTGYTPAPPVDGAIRVTDAEKAIRKTALGAERSVSWKKYASIGRVLNQLVSDEYEIVSLEQHARSIGYEEYHPADRVALIVGNEVLGISQSVLKRSHVIIELPMFGMKNSLNVSVAGGIALYSIAANMKS
jgi:23S rRNA (guanosine2251-2'-O)-methyltransferase